MTNPSGLVDTYQVFESQTLVTSGGFDYRTTLRVLVTAQAGTRSDLSLIVPKDYASVHNATNAAGQVVARRYVGEGQFVHVLVNGTFPVTYVLPRSVFFDTRFYRDLQDASKLTSAPYTKMQGYRNGTGSANSDAIQMSFVFDSLTDAERTFVRDVLLTNATGVANKTILTWTGPDWSSLNSPYLLGLPADIVRAVPARWVYSSPSHPENLAAPPPAPFWVRLFAGDPSALAEVLQWVHSGLVAVATFFRDVAQALVNFGSWVGDLTSGDPARVERAVQAAQNVWNQFLDSFFSLFTAPVKAVLAYLDGWKAGIVQAARTLDRIAKAFDGSPASVLRMGAAIEEFLAAVFRSDIVLLLTAMSFGIIAAVTATIATGIGYLVVSQVVPMIVSLIVSAVVQAIAPAVESALAWFAGLVEAREWKYLGVAIAGFDIAVSFLARFGGPSRLIHVDRVLDPGVPDAFKTSYGETINPVKTSRALIMAVMGFAVAVIPVLLSISATTALFLDILALSLGIVALYEALADPARVLYERITATLSGIEAGVSTLSLVGHIENAARGD